MSTAVSDSPRPADRISTLVGRAAIYEFAALGGALAYPELDGCPIDGSTAARIALSERRDAATIRAVLALAGVSL